MALVKGTRVGPYEILEPIGAGGMGDVYRARDTNLGRDVAIKVLPDDVAEDPARLARFEREARTLASLNHSNIAVVHGLETVTLDTARSSRALVMELVSGTTLAERIARGPIVPDEAVRIATQVASALEAAHAQGIIHRDIKPGNIILASTGHVKVLDFGLARQDALADHDTRTADPMTVEGTIMGTWPYLAPELLHGERADARSDVWAFGVVLYEMLSGQRPFTGKTAGDIGAAILHQPVPALPRRLPAAVAAIVERCLAKAPDDRYQRIREVGAALDAVRQLHDARQRGSRPWWYAAATVLVLLAALVLFQIVQPAPPADALPRLSTGGPASTMREANEVFELAMTLQSVQNDIPGAQQYLERAIVLDPGFAEALRYHALNYAILTLNGYTNDTSLLYKAEAELLQASRIAPNLLSLPAAYAAVYLTQGRKELIPWDQLERVIQQDPSNTNNRLWRGIAWWLSGDTRSARNEFEAALALRSLFAPARMFLAATLREEGDLASAILEMEKVIAQAPNNISAISILSLMYLDRGEPRRSRALLEDRRAMFAGNFLWRQAWALQLAVEGRREEALKALDEETLKFSAAAFPSTLSVAEFYAVLGDSARALEWIERTVRNGDERTRWFRQSPRLASLRDDPRFERILASVDARRGSDVAGPSR